jgi:hypothetical protein
VQAPFFGAQMPQLALQQKVSAPHVLLPHLTPVVSGTHSAIGGHGARMHWTTVASQWLPAAQRTVAQTSFVSGTQVGCAGHGARMHWTVCSTQCWPVTQLVASHEGALMHLACPLMSSQ